MYIHVVNLSFSPKFRQFIAIWIFFPYRPPLTHTHTHITNYMSVLRKYTCFSQTGCWYNGHEVPRKTLQTGSVRLKPQRLQNWTGVKQTSTHGLCNIRYMADRLSQDIWPKNNLQLHHIQIHSHLSRHTEWLWRCELRIRKCEKWKCVYPKLKDIYKQRVGLTHLQPSSIIASCHMLLL